MAIPATVTTLVIPAQIPAFTPAKIFDIFLINKNEKMKKQTNKLTLNKKTISNLTAAEMNKHVGGTSATGCYPHNRKTKNCTQHQNSCPGHNTCYTCV